MTTKALVRTNAPARRVVGKAIETNPLIAAIAQITPATLTDIAAEIKTTEEYLAGLRTMHQVGSVALGLAPAAPVAAEVVEEPEVAEVVPPAAPAPPKPAGDAPVMAHVLRAILKEQPAWTNDQVIAEAVKRGLTQGVGTIRTNLYLLRSKANRANKESKAPAKPAPAPKPAKTGPITAAQKAEFAERQEESTGLPPKDSPLRAEAELTLRKEVVEYVFKKGLASNGDLIRDCKVPARIVGDFMTHPWFEQHTDGRHRLTPEGKNQVEM